MLEIKNLSIKLNDTKDVKKNHVVLDNINLKIDKNEIHCLLGKNGSGKSTLAYALVGLNGNKKITGKIIFNGKDITNKKSNERAKFGIALAFQDPANIEGLTVEKFLMLGAKKNDKNAEKNLIKTLELVDLKEDLLIRKMTSNLSGGERKRIELASVIMMKPKLMILDEPDASLDIIVYNELYDLLLKIKNELNCSILLITHREEAGLVADKATFIDQGKIVASGKFREVMRQYCEMMGVKKRCEAGRKLNKNIFK